MAKNVWWKMKVVVWLLTILDIKTHKAIIIKVLIVGIAE